MDGCLKYVGVGSKINVWSNSNIYVQHFLPTSHHSHLCCTRSPVHVIECYQNLKGTHHIKCYFPTHCRLRSALVKTWIEPRPSHPQCWTNKPKPQSNSLAWPRWADESQHKCRSSVFELFPSTINQSQFSQRFVQVQLSLSRIVRV